jgi:hypothetical protein
VCDNDLGHRACPGVGFADKRVLSKMTELYLEWLLGVLTTAVSNLRVVSGLDLSIFPSLLRGQRPAQNENSSAKSGAAMQEPKALGSSAGGLVV